jgi:hypothetical protein
MFKNFTLCTHVRDAYPYYDPKKSAREKLNTRHSAPLKLYVAHYQDIFVTECAWAGNTPLPVTLPH